MTENKKMNVDEILKLIAKKRNFAYHKMEIARLREELHEELGDMQGKEFFDNNKRKWGAVWGELIQLASEIENGKEEKDEYHNNPQLLHAFHHEEIVPMLDWVIKGKEEYKDYPPKKLAKVVNLKLREIKNGSYSEQALLDDFRQARHKRLSAVSEGRKQDDLH